MIGKPRGFGLLLTLVVLVALPVTEIWLLVQLGGLIGVYPTLGLVILQAILGGWLMKREAGHAWRSMNDSIRTGETPTRQLADTAVVVVGGVALMFPGLLTDVVGLACLIPVTRPLPRRILTVAAERRIARMRILSTGAGMPFAGAGFSGRGGRSRGGGPDPGPGRPGYGSGGDVVPGEVVDDARNHEKNSGTDPGKTADRTGIIRGELDE